MNNLISVGRITPKHSNQITKSKIGLGFEKLDRDVFDPEHAYDLVAEAGVKWVRLQSGWQRTEREEGVYDFSWLDKIVDRFLSLGIEPWLCLCYGNGLYTPDANKYFGAVGCPPIATEREREAWANYVRTTVAHYKGKIHYYEIWNEPDGNWCWKHGANATELGEFTIATAAACRQADPDCKVIGLVGCTNSEDFLEKTAETGCLSHLDAVSYHCYNITDEAFAAYYRTNRALCDRYNPNLDVIQGESGCPSRDDGSGALSCGAWTEQKQAKFLLRHLLTDIHCGVLFTSYFSCMDMIEALNGIVGDAASYRDFGYFGVIGADFDGDGKATGNYTPKPSYTALQTLSSIFCEDYATDISLPITGIIEYSGRVCGDSYDLSCATCLPFTRPNGASALAYWVPKNILTETFESVVSIKYNKFKLPGQVCLVDLLTGAVYALSDDMICESKDGTVTLSDIPITDSPLLLTFGDFV